MRAIIKYNKGIDIFKKAKEWHPYFYNMYVDTKKNVIKLDYVPGFIMHLVNKETGRLIGWDKILEMLKEEKEFAEITIIEQCLNEKGEPELNKFIL